MSHTFLQLSTTSTEAYRLSRGNFARRPFSRRPNSRCTVRRPRSGFSLIEIVIVLAIMVVMAGMAVNAFMGTRQKANIDATKTSINTVNIGVDLYQTHMGTLPNTLEDLIVNPGNSNWSGPYLKKPATDAWGQPLMYEPLNDGYRVFSSGVDNTAGTDDDIQLQ